MALKAGSVVIVQGFILTGDLLQAEGTANHQIQNSSTQKGPPKKFWSWALLHKFYLRSDPRTHKRGNFIFNQSYKALT